ncbi:DUF3015 domain-containing protein [Marinomonas agarivorans]|nr:DUF3015 domain-containing protein [Marinomonas agarivorans]
MKKVKLFAIAAVASLPMLAQANPGCGFGSSLFEGEEGTLYHVIAATTNGTSGNQTFGMTSGTLGCDTSKPIVAAALFVNDNMDEVAENIANGEGEALLTLATLLEVEATDEFAVLAQQNFDQIFTSEDVTAEEVIVNLNQVVQG